MRPIPLIASFYGLQGVGHNMLRIKQGTPVQTPFSFSISTLGSFMCITQHTGPTAL